MKLSLLCMGKTREHFIQEGIEKYALYLRHYADLDIKELKEEKIQDLKQAPTIRKKEAERIFKAVPPGAFLISLDEHGEELTSHEFAAFLNKTIESGIRTATFVFGGPLGLDERVIAASHKVLALSRWTLTHEMARLVLLEQLYIFPHKPQIKHSCPPLLPYCPIQGAKSAPLGEDFSLIFIPKGSRVQGVRGSTNMPEVTLWSFECLSLEPLNPCILDP